MIKLPHYETLRTVILQEYRSDSLQHIYHVFIKPFILKDSERIADSTQRRELGKLL